MSLDSVGQFSELCLKGFKVIPIKLLAKFQNVMSKYYLHIITQKLFIILSL